MRIFFAQTTTTYIKIEFKSRHLLWWYVTTFTANFFRECPKLHYKHRTLTILLYNFRDLLKLLCKGICYALSLCKVKALLGFQNLHAYGSYFSAKPCFDVHNTFLRHIISNKSRK